MSLHKLAAGSGYTYLTKQVAAHDSTEKRQVGLAAYYEEKGETPGRWLGTGLAGLDLTDGDEVTEEQMMLLFGHGKHPLARHPDAHTRGWGPLGRAVPTFEATSLRQEIARTFSDHNTSHGLPWNHPIPPDERARLRTHVAREAFVQRHGRGPVDGAELTGFLASSSRSAQSAVAGFDLTFSPVKSVSALWALAPLEIAREVEAAHEAAVRSTLTLLEDQVAFTRVGKGGIRQIPVTGLVAAAYDHRDSRTGDPDLHTHLVVSNKAQSLPADGSRWLTLDGRMLFKAKVMASEHYNTHLEAELTNRLGLRFTDRPGPQGKRPVREITGMDAGILALWSSRRGAIETRQHELASVFLAEHGRVPTNIESLALAQQANLETRPAKHQPRSEGEQRQAWRQQASALYAESEGTVVGQERVTRLVTSVLGARQGRGPTSSGGVTGSAGIGADRDAVARQILEALEGSRATWQVWHVHAETLRQTRAAQVPLAQLPEFVRDVQHRVLTELSVPVGVPPDLGEPEILRRPDGQSAHTVHGSQTYTSPAILAAEEALLALGMRRDGPRLAPERIDLILAEGHLHDVALDPSQAAMVRALATSGCRLQVALAPAGSGKTTALAVLTRAWQYTLGDVIGLAPTAVAADELERATGVKSHTLAKFLHDQTHETPQASSVGPKTLVLIDEAAMAATRDLATAVQHVVSRGGSVRLVGDDQQLATVAAGGIFTDLTHQGRAHGTTVSLTELHRFTHPTEGKATLGIRDGDPAALDHYFTHDRIHTSDLGDLATASEQAYTAWTADRAAGKATLLLAATRDTVHDLNQRARTDRLHQPGATVGPEVVLADGTRASAGEIITTRRNDRTLRTRDGGSWVKNGDRWCLLAIHRNGSVSVERHHDRPKGGSRRVTLPAGYVAEHVQLGYASTVHGAQGATVDTTHTVLTGTENRQTLYVALSRGRTANHLYLEASEAMPDGVGLDQEEPPAGPREVFTGILARDGRSSSATTIARGDLATELRQAVLAYQDALPVLAGHHLGPQRMAELDDALEQWLPSLTEQPAYPHLRGQLALHWIDGTPPQTVVQDATWYCGKKSLAEANDPAAALASRISGAKTLVTGDSPLPWLPAIPPALRQDAQTSDYLDRLTHRINDLKQRITDEVHQTGTSDRMPWTRGLSPHTEDQLRGDLATWRAAHNIPPTDPSPTGPPMTEPGAARYQTRPAHRLDTQSSWSLQTRAGDPRGSLRTSQRRAEEHSGVHTVASCEATGPPR